MKLSQRPPLDQTFDSQSRYSDYNNAQPVYNQNVAFGSESYDTNNNNMEGEKAVEDDDDAPAQTGHELTANALCRANANECRACR